MRESPVSFGRLLTEIRSCDLCSAYLPHGATGLAGAS